MINVSDNYIELMKNEINNLEHKYTVKNITRDLDLSDLLINNNLKISRFIRQANGSISPSTIELSLEARADAPDKFLVKEFYRCYKEFKNKKWNELVFEESLAEYLVRKGDIVVVEDVFNNEKITVFTGKVQDLIKIDSFTGREIRLRVDDNTIKGHNYTFSEDYSYENHYIYNSSDKEHSLLFLLCKNHLEFPEDKLQIQDIKNTDGEHIRIPLATFKKGDKIMAEIGELVRSFYGNIYTMPDGSLKINSIFDKSYIQKLDITIGNKKGNHPVLEFIETTPVHPNENKVEVKYSNSYASEQKEVFKLSGKNSTVEDAKIIIKSNSNGQDYWKIEFKDVIDLDKNPIVEAYKIEGSRQVEVSYNEYILEWNNGNARVKFNNSANYDIFLKKFAFLGKSLNKSNENSILYTEHTNLTDKNTYLKTVNHKYIVSKLQATEMAKHTFYNECREYDKVKLKTNNMPFLELEDVINLDFKKYFGKYQIIAINQSHEDTELVLKKYSEYEGRSEFVISEIANLNFEGKLQSGVSITKEEKETTNREINSIKETIKASQQEIHMLRNKDTEIEKKIGNINNNISILEKKIPNDNKINQMIETKVAPLRPRQDQWVKLGKGQIFNTTWKKVMVRSYSYLWVWTKEEITISELMSNDSTKLGIKIYEGDNSRGYAISGYVYIYENKIDATDEYVSNIWVVK